MYIMQISLKKQIHKKKISNILKTYDIVLFFAIFDLPQKNKPLYTLMKKNVYQEYISNSNLNNLKDTWFDTSINKQTAEICNSKNFIIKSMSNKPAKHINLCSCLPLSGQTYLFAFKHEQHIQCFTGAKPLYRGVFLGGFYKGKYKTRTYLKTLCTYISRKREIYICLLKLFSYTALKHLRTTVTIYRKPLYLLKFIFQNARANK